MIQRHIYEIIVAKHNDGEIIGDKKVVATSSESALVKIDMNDLCKKENLTPDDIEYVILKLGSFRAVQEVATTDVSKF